MNKQRYWIAVVSKDHAMRGKSGGFMQVCHGKEAPLRRIKRDDWVVVYSPKLSLDGDAKLQSFTAIGRATDEEVYSFQMTPNFVPFRRNIKFLDCAEVSILPLINQLDFIENKSRWGYPFRFGFFEIKEHDFNLIKSKMLENEKEQNAV